MAKTRKKTSSSKRAAGGPPTRIRFTQDDRPFRRGEEHVLPKAEAEKFLRHGVAELCMRETTREGDEYQTFEPDTEEEDSEE